MTKKSAKKKPPKPPKKKLAREAKKPAVSRLDPARAEAAREVLENVFLAEKNFDLESLITEEVKEDAAGHVWVTVKLHVPTLDIDDWVEGRHIDHPDNQVDNQDDE